MERSSPWALFIFGALVAVAACAHREAPQPVLANDFTPHKPPPAVATNSLPHLPPPPPRPASTIRVTRLPVPDADFQAALVYLDQLAAIAAADSGQCDKMAADLGQFLDANRAEIDRMRDLKKLGVQPSAAQTQELNTKISSRLVPALMPCAGNPAMQAVMKKMS
jgi:hypothetical protein